MEGSRGKNLKPRDRRIFRERETISQEQERIETENHKKILELKQKRLQASEKVDQLRT